MMTVVTTLELSPDSQEEWDTLIRDRFRSAHGRAGWLAGQLLSPVDAPNTRVIIGTWRSQQDWQAWHEDADFLEARERLNELETKAQTTTWHHVVEDARDSGT